MDRQWHLRAVVVILAAAAFGESAAGRLVHGGAVQPEGTPAAEDIIDRVIARAKIQDDARGHLQLESIIETTVRFLDDEGNTSKTSTARSRQFPVAGALFEQLIARNGRPLSAGERRREREAREAFRRAAEEAAARGELVETDDERQVRFNRELVERYRTALAGETVIDGAPCWIIAFEPRDGPVPERTRLDRVMNRSKGRYYVRQQDAAVRRIEFELQRPVSYLWGLLAKLQSASGRLDFEQAAPGVWLPRSIDIRIELRIFFHTTRRHILRQWIERTPVAAS